ncbi:hypothetical protein ABTM05_19665, partial [Acinetobacter baumannii]
KSADAERAQETIREAAARAALASQRKTDMEKRYRAAVEAEQHRVNRQTHLEPERDRLRQAITQAREQGDSLNTDLLQART